jgi:U3 small nucleolar RNA-associated protein 13
MSAAPLLTTFTEVARHGRLYTGGKVEASADFSFLVCPCGAEVNVIEVASGRAVLTVPSAADEFSAFALRPDGQQLVTAGRSRALRSWSLDVAALSCEAVRVWKGHKMPVLELTYDLSGGLVASASADASAMVFDVDKGACTHVFRGHDGPVHLVAFHPVQTDKQLLLITAGHDNSVRVWDLHTRACRASLSSHVGRPTALAFTADGATMLSAGRDQLVNVWCAHAWLSIRRALWSSPL